MARRKIKMDRAIRVKAEGEPAFTAGLRSFLQANRGAFTLSEAKRIRKLRVGQEVCLGGGAASAFCITRPGTKSSLGGAPSAPSQKFLKMKRHGIKKLLRDFCVTPGTRVGKTRYFPRLNDARRCLDFLNRNDRYTDAKVITRSGGWILQLSPGRHLGGLPTRRRRRAY